MFGEMELRVLHALDTQKTRRELADELDYAPKTVTNALHQLEKIDLVTRDREGNETVVRPTDARCVEVYQSLSGANPHVDFSALLTKSMLTLLYYLDATEPKTARELVEVSGLARATVYRHLKRLTNRAVVAKNHSRYRLTEEFSELHTFAVELRHHLHRTQIRNDMGSGSLVWESHDEFLVRTNTHVDGSNYHRTGLDAFSEYGLDFFTTSEQYYFYSEHCESLPPEDLVCHLLLIENDARHRKYALLLVGATETPHEKVRTTAAHYGVEDILASLLEYLRTHGEETSPQTPPWEEMESLADDYGVSI